MSVNNDKYVSSPVSHSMTMAAVAWHFVPYDSTRPTMTGAERWSVLTGVVLTPNAGVGAGLSFGLLRGLAINVGELVIWNPTSVNGAAPGSAAPTGVSQLSHKPSYGTFLAGNYVFGGS
jgi:hypothetical protein